MLFLMVPSFCLKHSSGPNDVADVVGHIRSYIWSTDRYTALAPGRVQDFGKGGGGGGRPCSEVEARALLGGSGGMPPPPPPENFEHLNSLWNGISCILRKQNVWFYSLRTSDCPEWLPGERGGGPLPPPLLDPPLTRVGGFEMKLTGLTHAFVQVRTFN